LNVMVFRFYLFVSFVISDVYILALFAKRRQYVEVTKLNIHKLNTSH
jgi:hypothetical protein